MSLQPQQYPISHILDAEVARHVAVGWAVESRSETMAVVVSAANTNHVLHLFVDAGHLRILGRRLVFPRRDTADAPALPGREP